MNEFERLETCDLFMIPSTLPLTAPQRERAKEVNDLLDALVERTGIRESALFERVYVDKSEAHERLLHFLHHVSECPKEVLDFARQLLEQKHDRELQKHIAP